jgi:hypothetical protein
MSSESTSGEKISRELHEVFQKENLSSVFGLNEVDSWNLNWNELSSESSCILTFDNHKSSYLLRKIKKELNNSIESNELKRSLNEKLLQLTIDINEVHSKRLKLLAEKTFSTIFPNSVIVFSNKVCGSQLGILINITLLSITNKFNHEYIF